MPSHGVRVRESLWQQMHRIASAMFAFGNPKSTEKNKQNLFIDIKSDLQSLQIMCI